MGGKVAWNEGRENGTQRRWSIESEEAKHSGVRTLGKIIVNMERKIRGGAEGWRGACY